MRMPCTHSHVCVCHHHTTLLTMVVAKRVVCTPTGRGWIAKTMKLRWCTHKHYHTPPKYTSKTCLANKGRSRVLLATHHKCDWAVTSSRLLLDPHPSHSVWQLAETVRTGLQITDPHSLSVDISIMKERMKMLWYRCHKLHKCENQTSSFWVSPPLSVSQFFSVYICIWVLLSVPSYLDLFLPNHLSYPLWRWLGTDTCST